jgi:penicillin-binding protein activator
MKRAILLGLVLVVLLAAGACHRVKVTRIDTDTTTDLSGRWNDTDAKLVAEEMVRDVLSRPWYNEFVSKNEKKPVIIVGTVRNRSTEHIETDVFINDIERELINSGQVKIVASPGERFELRDELEEQQDYSTAETAKKLAAETGADLMLQGSINTIIDSYEGTQIKFYQSDLQLIDLQTTEKLWIGTQKTKKIVTKTNYKP